MRARKLGLRVSDARGWPIQRVARMAGVSESVLRRYIRRGELPAFKGAKHVYLDPAELVVVTEIDWHNPPALLEAAALRFLRQRLLVVLSGRARPGFALRFRETVGPNSQPRSELVNSPAWNPLSTLLVYGRLE
jgi:hypothetical protein